MSSPHITYGKDGRLIRKERVTLRQRQFMVEYLEKNFMDSEKNEWGEEDKIRFWHVLAVKLNSFENSPKKTISEWLKVWSAMRKTVKKKLEFIDNQKANGVRDSDDLATLNPFETRILNLMVLKKPEKEVIPMKYVQSRGSASGVSNNVIRPVKNHVSKISVKSATYQANSRMKKLRDELKTAVRSLEAVSSSHTAILDSIDAGLKKILDGQAIMVNILEKLVIKIEAVERHTYKNTNGRKLNE